MQLSINNDNVIDNPTAEQVTQAITSLGEEEFVILSHDENHYIQTLLAGEDGLLLEYQEGDVEEHYGVLGEAPSKEQVAQAFVAYLQGDDAWRGAFEWEQMDLAETDYTLIAAARYDDLEEGGEIDWETSIELPEVGVEQLAALYQLLCGGELRQRLEEFVLVAETSTEDIEQILLRPLPFAMQEALAGLSDADELAARWRGCDSYPAESLAAEETTETLQDLAALARRATQADETLLACELV